MAKKTEKTPPPKISEMQHLWISDDAEMPTEEMVKSLIGQMQMQRFSLEQLLSSLKQDVLSNSATPKMVEVLSYESLVMVNLTMSMSALLKILTHTSPDFAVTLSDMEAALRVLNGETLWIDSASFHFE